MQQCRITSYNVCYTKLLRVYADLNNNGTYDENEPSDVTNSSGLYVIPNLSPGTYVVREVQDKTGYVQTFPSEPDHYERNNFV